MEHDICHGVAKVGVGSGNCSVGTRPDCAWALRHGVPRFGALSKEVTPLLLLDLSFHGGHSTRVLLELSGELNIALIYLAISGVEEGK